MSSFTTNNQRPKSYVLTVMLDITVFRSLSSGKIAIGDVGGGRSNGTDFTSLPGNDNILKAIQFLISSNIGEIISLFTVIMATPLISKAFGIENLGLIEALLPIHILWVNLVTDSLPALALSVEPAEANIMQRKPNTDTKAGYFQYYGRRSNGSPEINLSTKAQYRKYPS